MHDIRFWQALDTLVARHPLVIDRPRGSAHPRYPSFLYPFDYGYLAGTHASDQDGIDVWVGSLAHRQPTAIVVTLDLLKRESEMKILLGCTSTEMQLILAIHNRSEQSAMLIERIAS
jgi:inorganic pyrophosphatase